MCRKGNVRHESPFLSNFNLFLETLWFTRTIVPNLRLSKNFSKTTVLILKLGNQTNCDVLMISPVKVIILKFGQLNNYGLDTFQIYDI